ncbi:MAG: hypothetical protein HC764_12040 [Pleurocapsa sp. CRU_1_2]|nr:hypothetical protein [Pleurocapsa sp. CRU_1_2]
MNTSIHIPKKISDRLNTYLKHHKIPKNKLIVKAIEEFLEKKSDHAQGMKISLIGRECRRWNLTWS